MNPIQRYLNNIIYGYQFGFFAAVIAGVAAAATVASTVMSMTSDSAATGQAAAGAAGANAAGISNAQMDELRKARDNANKYQLPYYNTGTNAQNKLSYMMGLGNTIETPNDNSVGTLLTQKQMQLQEHLATKPNAKNKEALKKWQAQKKRINDQIKEVRTNGENSEFYNSWVKTQDQTKKVTVPIDDTYGSLLKDFTAQDFQADPGYQFRKDQGNRELQSKLASIGMNASGSAVKEAINFNQGVADQAYQGAWQRYMDNRQAKTNTLFNMAGTGQRAADNISNNNNQYGTNVSNVLAQKGQAQQDAIYQGANAQIAGNQSTANAVGSIGRGLSSVAGYNSGINSSGIKSSYANTGIDSGAWGS